jgi:hypothetical protein
VHTAYVCPLHMCACCCAVGEVGKRLLHGVAACCVAHVISEGSATRLHEPHNCRCTPDCIAAEQRPRLKMQNILTFMKMKVTAPPSCNSGQLLPCQPCTFYPKNMYTEHQQHVALAACRTSMSLSFSWLAPGFAAALSALGCRLDRR